jgi:hypothetical protein
MQIINPVEIIKDILKFRGFKKATFKEKMQWIFIFYPFALGIVLFHLVLWIPYIPSLIKDKIKKRK